MITIAHYLIVSTALFLIGMAGMLAGRKSVINMLISFEVMLMAVVINLVAFSGHLGDMTGQGFALLILAVAVAQVTVGLAIMVVFYRNRGTVAVRDVNVLKG